MKQAPPPNRNQNQQKPKPSVFLNSRKTVDILGSPVDVISKIDSVKLGFQFMTSFQKHHIVTANSLILLEAQTNPQLQKAVKEASLVIPDSSGVSWAAMALSLSRLFRFPGIDFAYELVQKAEQAEIPVYLLGGESGVAKKAARFLFQNLPKLQISGMRDGFFQDRDENTIIEDIAKSRARLVLVALGMPKQEIWINSNFNHLPPAVYIGVGGSLDVWAGRTKRAPSLVQKSGFEWLYRFGQEPRRWKRMAQLPKFALKVISSRKQR